MTSYSNIDYKFFDYDLELGLTLNRLRERTRIIVTGFAGAGITHGRTFGDMEDADGNPYDFTSIDPTKPKSEVRADLAALSDGDFETAYSNKGAVLPVAGIYLGYQFSRHFSIGIEHRTTFSLTEENGTFGIDIDNLIVPGSGIDMNHYTSVGFRWTLGGGSSRRSGTTCYPEVVKSPVVHKDPVPAMPVTTIPEYKPDHHKAGKQAGYYHPTGREGSGNNR
ncbi:MAG: hypothetical protein R2744_09220 [Bacteroidales bacterium]